MNSLDNPIAMYDVLIECCDSTLKYNPRNRSLLRMKGRYLYTRESYYDAWDIFAGLLGERDSTFTTLKDSVLTAEALKRPGVAMEFREKAYAKDSSDIAVDLALAVQYVGRLGMKERGYQILEYVDYLNSPKPWIAVRVEYTRARFAQSREAFIRHTYNAYIASGELDGSY